MHITQLDNLAQSVHCSEAISDMGPNGPQDANKAPCTTSRRLHSALGTPWVFSRWTRCAVLSLFHGLGGGTTLGGKGPVLAGPIGTSS